MVRLVLMCGLAGAGKTTYARGLERRGWRRFSIDAELWQLGRAARTTAVTDDVVDEVRARHREAIGASLEAGQDVVVDYSFWSRSERDEYRTLGRGHGAVVEVVHLRTAEHVLRRRLAGRRGAHADDVVVGQAVLERYIEVFEPPGPDEHDVVEIVTTD